LVIPALVSYLPAKNARTLAEDAGEDEPHGVQHLPARAVWGEDTAALGSCRVFVADHLADPDAVLVEDKTGDLKEGTPPRGAERQYTGTAGARRTPSSPSISPTPPAADTR
jgi:SRSO17 transposase